MRSTNSWRWIIALVAGLALGTGAVHANTVSTSATPPPSHSLTVNSVGVTTTTTSSTHPQGTLVKLNAVPSAGYQFAGWSGGCSGSAPRCEVSMTGARTVNAQFNPVMSVALSGSGVVSSAPAGIDCGGDCSQAYAPSSSVTLRATPAQGFMFAGWGGACAGTALTCTVTMVAPRSVTARFVPVVPVGPFTLNVVLNGSGSVGSSPAGINCGSDCSESYPNNTSVTLQAAPAAGATFSGWSGACSGTGSCTVAMTQARSVTASFTAIAASGPIYYFSDCQNGAAPTCVPGNNANAGTSPSAPRQNLTGLDLNQLPAGTQLLFVRGGVWTTTGFNVRNLNATPTQPIVVADYGSGALPTFVASVPDTGVFTFARFNDTVADGGYTLRNLRLDGRGTGGWGVFMSTATRNVTLENMDISGFGIGVYSSGLDALRNTALTIRNSSIHHNVVHGFLGDGDDLKIEGNTFAFNNMDGGPREHGIYMGGSGRNAVIRNNTFTNNSAPGGVCTGGNLTVHGQWDGLLIEGNTVTQDASEGGCYGISIRAGYDSPEWFRRLVIRGNVVSNTGFCSICVNSAPGAVIENNLLVNTQPIYHVGVAFDGDSGAGDDADTGGIVRNNTVFLTQPAMGSEGIRSTIGNGLQVVSNLIQFGAATDPTHFCFRTATLAAYAAFDNNLCHHAGGTGAWSAQYGTLASARLAGFDVNGQAVAPLFVTQPAATNGWNEQLQAGSPAVGRGHPSRSSLRDRLGVTRVVPSIGSRELLRP